MSSPVHPSTDPDRLRWRLRSTAICLVFAAFCLNSAPGRLTPDTKTDLVVDPGHFLARSLHLWDAQGFAGQLQNQAYGYLFPMGPFFWVMHALDVPGWVAQRLWWTLLLSVAFLGVVRLARALGIGTPLTQTIAGCAYACSPHVLTLLGANSIESLPYCLAPWIVLPFVRGATGGSPRRAGLLFGVALLCLGGVNAAADAAAVVPAVLWLVTRRPGRRLLPLMGWSVVGGLLATLWWVVPLVLLGRYSPPFLDYIEDARTTTAVTSLAETLRGTADWVAYLPSSGWHAGYLLLTQPVLIAESLVVVALGLAGLATTRSQHRPWLVACLLAGLVAVTFGHAGGAGGIGSLFAGGERTLLDTVLAPVRNVHKFDLLIRLPLVLGLADLLPRLTWGRAARERRQSAALVRVVAVLAVVGTASPMVTLSLADSASFVGIPGYWSQTADWLGQHAGAGRALLVPASSTPDYIWGTPTDEPLQSLATSPWEVRDNIPLTTPGHIRMLDAVDDLLATGVSQPALAGYAARAGIRYLVVRNDLDYGTVQALAPGVVQATLAASPGLVRVAAFGPVISSVGDYSYSIDQGLAPPQAAVVVWQVVDGDDPRVQTAPTSSLTQLSGGPESVLQLAQQGADPGPTVLSGMSTGGLTPGRVVLTDGLRRREVAYGNAVDQHSDTLTAQDDGLIGRRAMDYLPVPGVVHQSVVCYLGVRSVTDSSSGADPDGFFAVVADQQAYSAFDDDPTTTWRSAPDVSPTGQWVQVTLDRPTELGRVRVRVAAPTTEIAVTTSTATGSSTASYPVPADGVVVAPVAAPTDRVRITITGVTEGPDGPDGPGGITDVTLPGVVVRRTVVAPDDTPTAAPVDVVSFATPGDARTGCLLIGQAPNCVAGRARASEDGARLDRTFVMHRAADYHPVVKVVPRPGDALTRLLLRRAGYPVEATASSQAVPDPLAGPQSVVDRDPRTGWVADPGDPDPTVTLHFPYPLLINHLRLISAATLAATRPDLITLVSSGGTRRAVVGGDGVVRFRPVYTRSISLHLASAEGLRPIVSSTIGGQTELGIGVTDVVVPGAPTVSRASSAGAPVDLACGSGPSLLADGQRLRTRIRATVQQVRDLRPVRAVVCGTTPVHLAVGVNHVVVAATPRWAASTLRLTRVGAAAPTTDQAPAARVLGWGNTDRAVSMAARSTPTLLMVDENANPGWRATLGGRTLPTVTVDGWRQGYVVPAGAAGTVDLTFAPQHGYDLALVGGAGCVVLLLGLVLVPLIRLPHRRRRRADRPGQHPAALLPLRVPVPLAAALGVGCCLLVGGGAGAVVAAATTVVVLALRRHAQVVLAVGPVLVVAAVLSVRHDGLADYAADTVLLQVLCLVSVAATIVPRSRT